MLELTMILFCRSTKAFYKAGSLFSQFDFNSRVIVNNAGTKVLR